MAATAAEVVKGKHSHYYKDVGHLKDIDVYRTLQLFGVTDQAVGHAIKKLLCAGGRGVKDTRRDIQEAIDTLQRRMEMYREDAVLDSDGDDLAWMVGPDSKP